MRILGIETSCDETALALVAGRGQKTTLLSQLVASQIAVHAKTGGVVPEVAARCHAEALPLMLAQFFPNGKKGIDAIAVTAGPGLVTSLRVGVDAARTLAAAWNIPVIGVNHMEGHILANWLDAKKLPALPALALVVSGGHTELILVKAPGSYRFLGGTRDDAVGETFDKVAKMLGLGYPGGPAVAKLAQKGNRSAVAFPRPMRNSSDFDFSYSGLKTAVLQHLQKKDRATDADVCASFEAAAIEILVEKTIAAAKKHRVNTVLLAGGVAANSFLRTTLANAVGASLPDVAYHAPELAYTTDNAAMIATAGYYQLLRGKKTSWKKLEVKLGWEIGRT